MASSIPISYAVFCLKKKKKLSDTSLDSISFKRECVERFLRMTVLKLSRTTFVSGETYDIGYGYRWNCGNFQYPPVKFDESARNPNLFFLRYHSGRGTEDEAEVHAYEFRIPHAPDSNGGGLGDS